MFKDHTGVFVCFILFTTFSFQMLLQDWLFLGWCVRVFLGFSTWIRLQRLFNWRTHQIYITFLMMSMFTHCLPGFYFLDQITCDCTAKQPNQSYVWNTPQQPHGHRAGRESEQDEEYVEFGIRMQSHSISVYSPHAWEVCDKGGLGKKNLLYQWSSWCTFTKLNLKDDMHAPTMLKETYSIRGLHDSNLLKAKNIGKKGTAGLTVTEQ